MPRHAAALPALLPFCLLAAGAVPYDENPTLGAPGSPTVDGAPGGEWTEANLISRGLANDDPRSLGAGWSMHETPWDLTHLYAAWDDDALTLAWQYVDVTDVVDPANAGSAGGTSPRQMNLVQWVALDTRPGEGALLDMWGKNGGEPYWTGADRPDHQIYVASNLWQGYVSSAVDGVFPVDDGGVHYFPIAAAGIEVAVGAGLAAATLPGVDDADHNLDEAAQTDFLARGHNAQRDTFYEMRIPLRALGIDRAALEADGLGVMLGQGEGSCLDTLPHDPATLDTPGTSPSNSPLEWADVDHFTVRFARVARAADGAGPADAGAGPAQDAGAATADADPPPAPDAGRFPSGDASGFPSGDASGFPSGDASGFPSGDAGGFPSGDAGLPPLADAGPGPAQDAGAGTGTGSDASSLPPPGSGGVDSGCQALPGRPAARGALLFALAGAALLGRRRRAHR